MTVDDGFNQLVADRAHGVQGRHGVLHDHADVGAADAAEFLFGGAGEFAALEADASGGGVFRPRKAEDRPCKDGFA